ncbi:TPA: hypothetical protein P3R69_005679 [Klebsiella pneumoniae]|uniref:hypothetical protein n=1 Tax=Klebsiella pneumoniae TaxID=573 RepID=UPI0024A81882|nr:hypothetical protein [Klebsiella pneumoniae]HDO7150717.1 hypothetical protein [Klebsiella pneumoniae]
MLKVIAISAARFENPTAGNSAFFAYSVGGVSALPPLRKWASTKRAMSAGWALALNANRSACSSCCQPCGDAILLPTTQAGYQVRSIAQSIYNRLRDEASLGTAFAERLDDDVLSRLQALPPRSVRLVLQRALGAAARDDRGVVQVQDIRPTIEVSRQAVGFVGEGWC